MRLVALFVGALIGLCAGSAVAKDGTGTAVDPIRIDAFPYVAKGTTALGPSSLIDSYSCATSVDESGPEVVYKFTLDAPARVTAWLSGDVGEVDIDVHILDDLAVVGTQASNCVARANVIAEADLLPGTHYVIVDTFGGEAQSGPFVLHVDAIGEAWVERIVANGVSWRSRRLPDRGNGAQVQSTLHVEPQQDGVEVRSVRASGCQTISEMAMMLGAVAAVNGGYYNTAAGGCSPVSLFKSDGVLIATNSTSRGAFGVTSAMFPAVAKIEAGEDWPLAVEAQGGGPIVVLGGTARSGNAAWAEEGIGDPAFIGRNPRTFAGFDGSGAIVFGGVDGRRPTAAGMSLDELAVFASTEVGAVEAVNLDGGGSTSVFVLGATPSGVVNYPSDGGTSEPNDHAGSRSVSGGLFVFALPFNHPPRFQTPPPLEAWAGEDYAYDADAIDLDVEDVVRFSLEEAPSGMTIDENTGDLAYAPTVASPPNASVTIVAEDGRGGRTEQSFELTIHGGKGPPQGAGGSGGGSSGPGAGTGAGTGAASGSQDGGSGADEGCGCRMLEPSRAPEVPLLAAALSLLLLRRRPFCRR